MTSCAVGLGSLGASIFSLSISGNYSVALFSGLMSSAYTSLAYCQSFKHLNIKNRKCGSAIKEATSKTSAYFYYLLRSWINIGLVEEVKDIALAFTRVSHECVVTSKEKERIMKLSDRDFLEQETDSEKSQKTENIFYCTTVLSNIPALIQSALTGPGLTSVFVLKDVLMSGYSTITYCRSILSVQLRSEKCKQAFTSTITMMENVGKKLKSIELEEAMETLASMKNGF